MERLEVKTVGELREKVTSIQKKLREVVNHSPEPHYVEKLIFELTKLYNSFSVFGNDRPVDGIYNNDYPERLLRAADLFIDNPDFSIHTMKETIHRTDDLVALTSIMEAYLKESESLSEAL